MKSILLFIFFMVSASTYSQVGVNDLQSKRNVSNILKEGYVQNGNTFNKSNGDKIVFTNGENIWFGNDKKTYDNLKSSINSSYKLVSSGSYSTHQYFQYQKGNITYIFLIYNSGSQYKYTVNVASSFGSCGM